MPCYTFILEYKGGTYMSQNDAPSPAAAFLKGAKDIAVVNVTGLRKDGKASLIEQMKTKSNKITAITGLTNAWCSSALIHGRLAILTVIQTDQSITIRD